MPSSLLFLYRAIIKLSKRYHHNYIDALDETADKLNLLTVCEGYSSLIVLEQLPFDILKIDRAFVHNIHQDPKNQAIVAAIVQMANNLNLSLVVEGIETAEELAFLREQK